MKKTTLMICSLLLSACSIMPKEPNGFQMRQAQTEHFTIPVWEKAPLQSNRTIRFYIEGNGNPTPDKPVALMLAAKDNAQNIVVLSRPCQYSKDKLCEKKDIYGKNQYSPEIINEMEELVTFYIQKYKAPNIEFVAYDGGAPVAFSLASNIGGVKKIVTIAGILDVDAYVNKNNLPDFEDAQSPIKLANRISQIPQVHFVGGKDEITTPGMAERFVSKLHNPTNAQVKLAPNMGHTGWEKIDLSY